VEKSTRIRGAARACATPRSPKTQFSTASVCKTQTSTISLASATTAGEEHGIAPKGTTVSTLSGSRFQTETCQPLIEESARHCLSHQADADESYSRPFACAFTVEHSLAPLLP